MKQNNGTLHRLKENKNSCQALWQRHKKSIRNTKITLTKASMPLHSKLIDNCLWNHNYFSDEHKLNGWSMNRINCTFLRFSKKKKNESLHITIIGNNTNKIVRNFCKSIAIISSTHSKNPNISMIVQFISNWICQEHD